MLTEFAWQETSPQQKTGAEFLEFIRHLPVETHTHRTLLTVVATVTGVSAETIRSSRRSAPASKARHILCWLCFRYSSLPTTIIGRHTGGRNHHTVMYGAGRAEAVRRRLGLSAHADPASWAEAFWSIDWPSVSVTEVRQRWHR